MMGALISPIGLAVIAAWTQQHASFAALPSLVPPALDDGESFTAMFAGISTLFALRAGGALTASFYAMPLIIILPLAAAYRSWDTLPPLLQKRPVRMAAAFLVPEVLVVSLAVHRRRQGERGGGLVAGMALVSGLAAASAFAVWSEYPTITHTVLMARTMSGMGCLTLLAALRHPEWGLAAGIALLISVGGQALSAMSATEITALEATAHASAKWKLRLWEAGWEISRTRARLSSMGILCATAIALQSARRWPERAAVIVLSLAFLAMAHTLDMNSLVSPLLVQNGESP
jgi:hypothetical protein